MATCVYNPTQGLTTMNFTTVQGVGEAVAMIESRIPGGKWMVRLALFLALAAGIIGAFTYIWEKAIVPLSRVTNALFTGSPINFHLTIGDVVVWTGSSVIFVMFKGLMNKNLDQTHRLIEIVKDVTGEFSKLSASLKQLEARLAVIEYRENEKS